MAGGSWRARCDWLHDASSARDRLKKKLAVLYDVAPPATERARSVSRSLGLRRDASVARFCLATRESDF